MLDLLLAVWLAAQPPAPPPGAARGPSADLSIHFTADRYPLSAHMRGLEGIVGFRIDIDAAGYVTRCEVASSSGSAALDAATCSIFLGQVRYEPARDSRGRPIASRDDGRVTWRLPPQSNGMPFRPVRMMTLVTRVDGEVHCRMAITDQPVRDVAGAACAGDAAIVSTLDSLGAGGALALVYDFTPGDAPVAEPDAGWGDLILDSRARVGMGPDGRMDDCSVTQQTMHRQLAGVQFVPDQCDVPFVEKFQSTDRPGRRSGTLAFRLFARSPAVPAAPASSPPPPPPAAAQRPRANLQSYFTSDDYPPSAIARGAEGRVGFELGIDARGYVAACTISESSGDAALDAATCAIMLGRSRYAPARDANGRPTTGNDRGWVTWRLPPAED